MRTTVMLLAVAVLAVALLAACRARDQAESDSVASDAARADDTAADSGAVANDSDATSASVSPREKPRPKRAARPFEATATDSELPPDDSIRAMRPEMPQITPEKRPRTWRGFKLPEEMPVRVPVETIKRVEQAPDSVMKGDSTKPPPRDR